MLFSHIYCCWMIKCPDFFFIFFFLVHFDFYGSIKKHLRHSYCEMLSNLLAPPSHPLTTNKPWAPVGWFIVLKKIASNHTSEARQIPILWSFLTSKRSFLLCNSSTNHRVSRWSPSETFQSNRLISQNLKLSQRKHRQLSCFPHQCYFCDILLLPLLYLHLILTTLCGKNDSTIIPLWCMRKQVSGRWLT